MSDDVKVGDAPVIGPRTGELPAVDGAGVPGPALSEADRVLNCIRASLRQAPEDGGYGIAAKADIAWLLDEREAMRAELGLRADLARAAAERDRLEAVMRRAASETADWPEWKWSPDVRAELARLRGSK